MGKAEIPYRVLDKRVGGDKENCESQCKLNGRGNERCAALSPVAVAAAGLWRWLD